MHRILPCLALLFFCGSLAAQKIENVKATINGDDIIITYDLSGKEGQEFKINLYISNNNFSRPLIKASGDIGSKITPGKDKRVVWNAKNELPEYKGDLIIEVRGEAGMVATLKPLAFLSPAGGSIKRGKLMNISWTGGTPGETVELSLFKGGEVKEKISEQSNNGVYSWQVPKKTKSGSYQLKLTGNSSGFAMSTNFKIKPRTPFIVKLLPFVVVGAVAYVVLGSGDKSKDLPPPPDPN